jgi:bacterioferritin-associated ferredoxin
MSLADRLKHHLQHVTVGTRSRGQNKKLKRPKNYSHSRAYRFAMCAARKDERVRKSSRGRFHTVAELRAHTGPGCSCTSCQRNARAA